MSARQSPPPNAADPSYWNSPATRAWSESFEIMDRLAAALTLDALDFAAPRPGERVLDLGCGSGTTVLALAARVGAAGHVLGVDVAAASVAKARERIAASGLGQAEMVLADAATHPFPQQSFDLAFSRFGVMFFADPIAAFGNIRRALKPGGRLALVAFRKPAENPWATGPVEAVRRLLPPMPPPVPNAPGQFGWADEAWVRHILQGGGFRDIALAPHDPRMRLGGPGEAAAAAANSLRIGPLARATLDMAPAEREAVRAGVEAFYRRHDGPEGIVLPGAVWFVSATA